MTNNVFRRVILLFAALCVMTAPVLAPANARFLDKTRFVFHVGVGYFAFHHWVSGPYKNGAFQKGAPHRTGTIIKAGVALLFAVHEMKVASKIAHNSKDPLLQKLAGGLDSLTGAFSSIGSKFKSGQFSPDDYSSLKGAFGSFDGSALASGLQIKDRAIPIPGA